MEKGNIVTHKAGGSAEGLVLAVRKDGKAGKVYILGSDGREAWWQSDKITVIVSGNETCWKCGGSGIFYGGGIVENGVYKGYSGECYGCAGKGTQNNADRVRNHYYWHRERAIYEALDAIEKGEVPAPLPHPPTGKLAIEDQPVVAPAKSVKRPRGPRSHSGGAIPAVPDSGTLIDCKGCDTVHRDDVMCPW